MLRIIVRTDDIGAAVHVGGAVATSFRSFDVSLPDVESFLEKGAILQLTRQVIGVEVIASPSSSGLGAETGRMMQQPELLALMLAAEAEELSPSASPPPGEQASEASAGDSER